MNRKLESPWIISVLFLLAIISGWQFYQLSFNNQNAAHRNKHFPDSIGYNLTLKRYDKTGFLESVSRADTATHYPDTNVTDFKNISMQAFNPRPGVAPWLVTAPHGQAYHHEDKFELNGTVLMTQAAYANHPATKIQTSEVTIMPNEKLISGQNRVQLMQPGLAVTAVGFTYNYDKEILNLLSQVQIDYDPAKYPKA